LVLLCPVSRELAPETYPQLRFSQGMNHPGSATHFVPITGARSLGLHRSVWGIGFQISVRLQSLSAHADFHVVVVEVGPVSQP
jgi:hypothetical protein